MLSGRSGASGGGNGENITQGASGHVHAAVAEVPAPDEGSMFTGEFYPSLPALSTVVMAALVHSGLEQWASFKCLFVAS